MKRTTPSSRRISRSPLLPGKPPADICLELEDNSVVHRSAVDLFGLRGLRDPQPAAARVSEQFTHQNRALLSQLDVRIEVRFDGGDVTLEVHSGNTVGAIPLISPTTARHDYGLIVQPRFPWAGIGPMLATMGWRISPNPLRLPLLRRSERKVPPWVLSSMILVRLKALLDSLDRRFEMISEDRIAPRGRVDWNRYTTACLPRARYLSVPCTFPDLRDDRLLKGAIRYTVERQIRSLETQKEHGAFVHRLIDFAEQVQRRVRTVPVYMPSSAFFSAWQHRPLRTETFIDGLHAIEWTTEERGLAGLSDLEGIPWNLPMERFFEAWVETVLRAVAVRTGGHLKVGRQKETTHPISWDPPYLGSQKALVPDLWLECAGVTVIVDAKYKRHWEELQQRSWSRVEDELRAQHRHDLLQVLAYANLAHTERTVACIAYPCSYESWESLRDRGRLFHRAELGIASRSISLWLTAVPIGTAVDLIAAPLADEVRRMLPANN